MNRNKNRKDREREKNTEVEKLQKIEEPRPVCTICGEPIEAIIEAISEPEGYSHFDCVLNLLKEEYKVGEDEKISYIGKGCFGIFLTDPETKGLVLKERIAYESSEGLQNMKNMIEEIRK